jgi:hypothetical protein
MCIIIIIGFDNDILKSNNWELECMQSETLLFNSVS